MTTENTSKSNGSKGLQYYMRVLHRDLGFIALAMVVVYSLSGITLIHRTSDFMKTTTQVETTLETNLSANQLAPALKMKKLIVTGEENGIIYFAEGQYEKETGKVQYQKKDLIFPFNKFSKLHKVASAQEPLAAVFTTLFGVVLFFLAVSSLLMFKPGTKLFKKGLIYTGVGVLLTVVLIAVFG